MFLFYNNKGIKTITYSVIIFATIHYSYGLGFLVGYLKSLLELFYPKKIIFNDYGDGLKLLLFILIFFFHISNGQPIPNEFMEFYKKKILIDSGENWNQNSIFSNLRRTNFKYITDSLLINSRLGFQYYNKGKALYGSGHFTYNKNFYGYLYSRIVDRPEFFERYSGIERNISRFGFTSGETDQSGICYENDWLIFQFGRGRESWGAGNDIQLGLNENSNSYDYGLLDLDFGKLRVRYFNGYLETDSLNVSRYITGRGIEWNNEKNLLLDYLRLSFIQEKIERLIFLTLIQYQLI